MTTMRPRNPRDVTTGYRLAEARRLIAELRRVAQQPSLILLPRALRLLVRGIDLLARPLALTLGPARTLVLNERTRSECEVLADASTIARRVIALRSRSDNLGAMLLRKMALELHERYGDGVALAAVMVRSLVHEACRRLAAGASPPALARGLQRAVEAAEAALESQARPLGSCEEVQALVLGATGDVELSEVLARMFEVLGPCSTIVTEELPRPGLDHEYIRGGKWDGYIPARALLPEGEAGLILRQPWIVLADEELHEVEQVLPMLELVLAEPGRPPLLVVARAIRGPALTMLTANHVRGLVTLGLLVLSSGATLVHDDLADMAALTGGTVLSELTGTLCRHLRREHLGRAQQAILTPTGVTIVGGQGHTCDIQQRLAGVRAQLREVARGRQSEWEFLRLRLARLTGGIGILKIGAISEHEMELRKEQAEKALRVLEAAYEGGLVPGGGVALLNCLPALQAMRASCADADERQGVALLEAALQEPFLQIVRNYGAMHPPLVLEEVRRRGADYGFDALRGEVASMWERGILDCCSIVRGALRAAVSLATMLVTTDAVVFHG
ncbi:60 kDa chaperonin [Thermogemmatispora aurantia]|uniref:TCP-1/cpn60 chaperonin family protein n=1 Tax=Thermogemmatispora aurantia TaxID=2045279 RepID=UPI00124ED76A|nr:TCP-1/cpn60 chaperonin family protein [Thermogemmatispora aurantia]GER84273.1 60 kDa chaperonin [Thermogemmatispora aurantia]